jgi:hypothetical protein
VTIVCNGCGGYIQPVVNVADQSVCCPECEHVEPMRILPLFIVTGASGVGKTVVVSELRRLLPDWDIFETDVMHAADWQQQRNNWLRVAHSIAQGGRHTILCGTMLPADMDRCDHRPFFSKVCYLNLHCDDETRAARLRARPTWRGCDEAFIEKHRKFAQWLLEHATTDFDPPMPTVDTTHASTREVAEQIRDWSLGHATANSVY